MYIPMIVAVSLLLAGLTTLLYAALNFGMAEASGSVGFRTTARRTRAVGIAFVAAALVVGVVDLLT